MRLQVSDRQCGECNACCTHTIIEAGIVGDKEKPAGTECHHISLAGRCGIYASRPPVCRVFECLWKASPAMREDERPDRCGVMASISSRTKHPTRPVLYVTATTSRGMFNAPVIASRLYRETGSTVMLVAGVLGYGKGLQAVIGDPGDIALQDGESVYGVTAA